MVEDISPTLYLQQATGRGEGNERDRGALVRVTPIGANVGRPECASGIRVDTAVDFSERNYAGDPISYLDVDQTGTSTEERLIAGAARVTALFPVRRSGLWNVLTPGIAASATWEQARYYNDGARVYGDAINRTGEEIDLFGLVQLRHGSDGNPELFRFDDTWGLGVRIQYRGIAGVRYDWARIHVVGNGDRGSNRAGFILFFDPSLLLGARNENGSTASP